MRHLAIVGVLIAGICIIAGTGFAAPIKKKDKAAKIPASVLIENTRGVDLTELSLAVAGAEGKVIASLKKAIPPGKKISLSLKGLKSCNISIAAAFADDGDSSSEADICIDHVIRFVD